MPRQTSIALLIALTTVASVARAADSWDAALGRVDVLFEKFAAETHAPGLIYGVVREGRLAHVHAIGTQDLATNTPVNADTVFRIASLTKGFTALAALNLAKEGRLELDAPVARYVPQLRILPVRGVEAATPRLRQLLAHTGGLVTDDPWADRELNMAESEFSRVLATGLPIVRSPGEAFEYSNMGYAVLGRAISQASGRGYDEYISQILLRPLGMTSTVWDLSNVAPGRVAIGYSWVDDHLEAQPALPHGAFGAVAGLSTTAKDYGRFVAWLLSAWRPESASAPHVIDLALVREAGRGVILSQVGERPGGPDGRSCPVAWMYGAGFYAVTDCELGWMLRHPGGLPGFGSQVLLLPRASVGIFAFASLTYAHLSDPVVQAAVLLNRAGLLDLTAVQPGPELTRAASTALRIYQAGDVGVGGGDFASNVLLDRSAARRNAQLRRERATAGDCLSIAPADITHALAGRFELACEHGTLQVMIALAPVTPAKIQYLEFEQRLAPPAIRTN